MKYLQIPYCIRAKRFFDWYMADMLSRKFDKSDLEEEKQGKAIYDIQNLL